MNKKSSIIKKSSVISRVFKVRLKEVEGVLITNIPERKWQRCITDGNNVVWNNFEKKKVLVGEEVWVETLWKRNVQSSEKKRFSEPTFYIK